MVELLITTDTAIEPSPEYICFSENYIDVGSQSDIEDSEPREPDGTRPDIDNASLAQLAARQSHNLKVANMPPKKLPFWCYPAHRQMVRRALKDLLLQARQLPQPIHQEHIRTQTLLAFRRHRHNTSPSQCSQLLKEAYEERDRVAKAASGVEEEVRRIDDDAWGRTGRLAIVLDALLGRVKDNEKAQRLIRDIRSKKEARLDPSPNHRTRSIPVRTSTGHLFTRRKPFIQPHWISMMMKKRAQLQVRRYKGWERNFSWTSDMVIEEKMWESLGLKGPAYTSWSEEMRQLLRDLDSSASPPSLGNHNS
ncbi:MAG: hypothetical protein DHS80DRAFT_32813 [Piptocephalis tieghemiana]|nr:MAG: hypothetical protein DHS80DRAFT_32813 [Piptocephalis tieghemiana]